MRGAAERIVLAELLHQVREKTIIMASKMSSLRMIAHCKKAFMKG